MVQYIFTPWRNRDELLRVRQQFFPDKLSPKATPTADAKRAAIARVSMWMLRGSCPHMVESTAILTSALLHDAETPSGAATIGVRAEYSMGFSRYVYFFYLTLLAALTTATAS